MTAAKSTRGHKGLGNVRQRADGRWEARIRTPYGGQRSAYRRTETEARDALAQLIGDRDTPARGRQSATTVRTWFTQWIRDDAMSHSSRVVYQVTYTKWIDPEVGRIPVAKLTTADVSMLRRRMEARGASQATVRSALKLVRNGLTRALHQDPPLVKSNVAQASPMPAQVVVEIVPPTPAEVLAILAMADQHSPRPYALAIHLAALTGLRQGEVLGLTWGDLAGSSVTITQQLSARTHALAPTKTRRSRRTLRLPATMVAALEAERRRQVEAGRVTPYLFAQASGAPLAGRSVLREFHRLCDLAGLPRFRFHDLRHAAATRLLAQGVPMALVSAVVGHARISTTVDTYGHLTPADVDLAGLG